MSGGQRPCDRRCAAFAVALTALALITAAFAASAQALTTIGRLAPQAPAGMTSACTAGNDILQPTVTGVGGPGSYVVPAGGARITSWSTIGPTTAGEQLTMKVFRKVADPNTYRVIAHDGPRGLAPGVLNSFPVSVAVQPGDVLGLSSSSPTSGCAYAVDGETYLRHIGPLGDGTAAPFDPRSGVLINVQAVVATQPSNQFSFNKLVRNKAKGTAKLPVQVPGPGTLALTGKGVKVQRAGGEARVSRAVKAAGTVKLTINAKGAKKATLKETGKVKVKVKVTYTPSGDVPGVPKTLTRRIKLIKSD
jgi:hypothetical protein